MKGQMKAKFMGRLYDAGRKAQIPKKIRDFLDLKPGDWIKVKVKDPARFEIISKIDKYGRFSLPKTYVEYYDLSAELFISGEVEKITKG